LDCRSTALLLRLIAGVCGLIPADLRINANAGPFLHQPQRPRSALLGSAAASTIPKCCDTSVILSQLETSRPRGSERVAFIAFGNLRSFTRYGCLVLGKLDHFTAPVTRCRAHFYGQQISNVKFDHFRHNIIPSIRIRQSRLRTNTTRCSRDDNGRLLCHTFLLFERSDPIHSCD